MPGLLRGVARTAVVAGTATAVSGRVQRRQAEKYADRDAQIAADREQAYEQQTAAAAAPPRPGRTGRPGPERHDPAAEGPGRAARPGHPHRRGVRRPEGEDPRVLTDRRSEVPTMRHPLRSTTCDPVAATPRVAATGRRPADPVSDRASPPRRERRRAMGARGPPGPPLPAPLAGARPRRRRRARRHARAPGHGLRRAGRASRR